MEEKKKRECIGYVDLFQLQISAYNSVSASATHLYLGKTQGSPIHIVLFARAPTQF